MKGDKIIQFDLEEYHGEWEIIKQYDTRKEAEQELRFYRNNYPGKFRVVGRLYKVLFKAN